MPISAPSIHSSSFWTLALLAGERALRSRRPILAMAGAGAVWSLALLTKIHAWFLLPILAIWSLVRLPPRRRRGHDGRLDASPASACFGRDGPGSGIDSWRRLLAYWGTGVARSTIMVQYFGQVFADRDVPWHYPWFYFAVTVPIGLQALGIVGVFRGWTIAREDPFPLLLAGSIVFFLILFSTSVPVYDGERLFLHVFPAWAMLIGLGFGWLRERLVGESDGRGGVCRRSGRPGDRGAVDASHSGSAITTCWSADYREPNGSDWR